MDGAELIKVSTSGSEDHKVDIETDQTNYGRQDESIDSTIENEDDDEDSIEIVETDDDSERKIIKKIFFLCQNGDVQLFKRFEKNYNFKRFQS